ncbi:hypothetical protein H6778_01375 [Candidatus Nomurabacteria bacterium]|nr:hypothetical protein [Candidatus Nomurabacteria bacterium]
MKFWEEYTAYIKDNPEGYWFKRKLYGYGWTPAKPAGWAVVGLYLLFVLGMVLYAEYTGGVEASPFKFVAALVAATLLLIVVSWRTGEPPKWQWGAKHHSDQ